MRPLWQFGSTCGTPHTDRPADTGREEEIMNVDGVGAGDVVKDVVVVALVVVVAFVVVVVVVVVVVTAIVDVVDVVVDVVELFNRSVYMREF